MQRDPRHRFFAPADASRSPRRRHARVPDGILFDPVPFQPQQIEPLDLKQEKSSAFKYLVAALVVIAVLLGLGIWLARSPYFTPRNSSATTRIALPEAIPYAMPSMQPPGADASGEPLPEVTDAADGAGSELSAPELQSVLPAMDDVVVSLPEAEGPASAPAKRAPSPLLIFDADAGKTTNGDSGIQVFAGSPKPNAAAPAAPIDRKAMVTRGTLIPAVLESVIDTNKPGGVRAVVTTDVRSSDGRKVLIPRSSRLVGQYRSEGSGSGERTYVIWTRIDQPGGKSVPLSGASGGAGGKADNKFLASFGAAKLQSIVSGNDTSATGVRVRQGEPIRVYAAGDVEIARDR